MSSRLTESAFNPEFAAALRDRHPRWSGSAVLAESTGVLRDGAALRPDIVVTGEIGLPVVIEAEFEPAHTVEDDALRRLGTIVSETGRTVDVVLAVRVPEELRDSRGAGLSGLISSSSFQYCCYTAVPSASACTPGISSHAANTAAKTAPVGGAAPGDRAASVGGAASGGRAAPVGYREHVEGVVVLPGAASGAQTVPVGGAGLVPVRFPARGWLRGGVDDIAGLIERMMLPESAIAAGALALEHGVNDAAAVLDLLERTHRPVLECVARSLRQDDGRQTRRMAMAICANALVFQAAIAGTREGLVGPSHPSLRSSLGMPEPVILKSKVLEAWDRILEVNYWPIFAVASEIVDALPVPAAAGVLERLAGVADEMAGLGVVSTGDLAGQMFGRLISDRKFLATFYTLPSSAALLAELAVERLDCDFGERAELAGLRVGDLACGTGMLLSSAYRSLGARYRRRGGDDEGLHKEMMEQCLIGADIMPAAAHLTASVLSGVHPSMLYDSTRVHTMPYGRHSPLHPVAVGSLDLLGSEQVPTLFRTGRTVAAGEGERPVEELGSDAVVPDNSLDLVIMNPPFSRNTSSDGSKEGVPRPAFAGFETSEAEQQQMAERLEAIYRAIPARAGHGNAGLASNFVDLAHAKVRPGGVVALVLPVSVASGAAWQKTRELLRNGYTDAVVVSIASSGSTHRAFSADTAMAEALVIAKRAGPGAAPGGAGGGSAAEAASAGRVTSGAGQATARAGSAAEATNAGRVRVPTRTHDDAVLWVSLHSRPRNPVEAAETARAISAAADSGRGSGHLRMGADTIGCFVRGGWSDGGCAGVASPDVVEAAAALAEGVLRLPGLPNLALPLAPLGSLGDRGPYHRDVNGTQKSTQGVTRGPFDIDPLPKHGALASYPVLWGHDAERERQLVVAPDKQGTVRPGRRDHALRVWRTAARLHINLDFRLNSQSLAGCLTHTRSIGGRAWPSFRLHGRSAAEVEAREKLTALWLNTTLGLLGFWWLGTRQHQGRTVLSVTRLPDLMSIDPGRLSAEQMQTAGEIFDELATRRFKPAHAAVHDEARIELDEAVLAELLTEQLQPTVSDVLESLGTLRDQWCAEPSVHGGKVR